MANDHSTLGEIHQTRPFASPRQEAVISLLLTADRVRRQVEKLIASNTALSVQQYNVLRILRGAGVQGLCTLEIAGRMIERAPGITRLLDRLERDGFVTRTRGKKDRREVRCQISQRGLQVLAAFDPIADENDAAAIGDLSATELKQLLKLLERIRATQPVEE